MEELNEKLGTVEKVSLAELIQEKQSQQIEKDKELVDKVMQQILKIK